MPGHLSRESELGDQILAAVRDLPASARDTVDELLAAAVAHYDETSDVGPLKHFADSLLMTARLHRNAAYKLALAEADAEDARPGPREGVDVHEFISRMRQQHQP